MKLSVLTGGTVAYPHAGPTNAKLRVHLPLVLPEHRLGEITVAGETRAWREGEPIIFDDSLEHYVVFDAEPSAQRTMASQNSRKVSLRTLPSPSLSLMDER